MTSGIYGIEYKGKVVYVGQSVDIERRVRQHFYDLRTGKHRNFVLQRMHDKNPEALGHRVLEVITGRDQLTKAEQHWMDELKSRANLMKAINGRRWTEADREKKKAYVYTAEHCRNISKAKMGQPAHNKGKKGIFNHSDDAKARIAAASRGRKYSPESSLKRSLSQKGRVLTEEHREKLRLAKLGKPNEAVRRALTGRELSPEHRANIVAGMKAARERREAINDAAEQ